MTQISESPLGGFEERLLAELKEVVATCPGPYRGRARAPRSRMLAAAAIGVTAFVVAGLAIATAVRPGGKPAVRYSLAADFLNRAAAAVRAQNAPLPRPDQAAYVEQLIVSPGPDGGIRECQVYWYPSPLTGLAVIVGGGKCQPGVPPVPAPLEPPGFGASGSAGHWYPALNTLPTSPAALRAALYAAAARGGAAWGMPSSYSADQIVFMMIDKLVEMPLSGSLRAALYEVIAKVPGVSLVNNAVDAAGRHGVGITIRHQFLGYGPGTVELIFKPGTYTLLGGADDMPGQRVFVADLGSGLVTVPRS